MDSYSCIFISLPVGRRDNWCSDLQDLDIDHIDSIVSLLQSHNNPLITLYNSVNKLTDANEIKILVTVDALDINEIECLSRHLKTGERICEQFIRKDWAWEKDR